MSVCLSEVVFVKYGKLICLNERASFLFSQGLLPKTLLLFCVRMCLNTVCTFLDLRTHALYTYEALALD